MSAAKPCPREPTPEMLDCYGYDKPLAAQIWRAMWEAAPQDAAAPCPRCQHSAAALIAMAEELQRAQAALRDIASCKTRPPADAIEIACRYWTAMAIADSIADALDDAPDRS